MEQQVTPINLRMLAEAALNFYIDPPKDLGPIPPEELLAFAKKYANGLDVFSFKTTERLVQTRKIDAGLAMACEVAALAPADLRPSVMPLASFGQPVFRRHRLPY